MILGVYKIFNKSVIFYSFLLDMVVGLVLKYIYKHPWNKDFLLLFTYGR